jgi:hypothetical protein
VDFQLSEPVVSTPNLGKNWFCSFFRLAPFFTDKTGQNTGKNSFSLLEKGPPFSLVRPVSIHYTNPEKNRFCSFSKWPAFSLVRPVSNPAKNRLCSVAKWPPFSLIRTRTGQHTKPWKEPVFVPFQNGLYFPWLEPIGIRIPGKNRLCSFLKMAAVFTG